jgi:6-phosphogluconolactonase (cycloisomerase 2 family)
MALALTLLFISAFAFAGTPRFAYVPNIDDGTISQYSVNASTGQLLPNSYVLAGDHPRSFVQVGNYAYVVNMNSNNISAYSLSQSTGQLSPLSTPTYTAPGTPYAAIAHPNGKFLYVVSSAGNTVYIYSIASNGSLVEITNTAAGTSPRFLAITANGEFLYVANYGSNNVTAYKVSATAGTLTHVGTYSTGGSKPSNIMVSNNFLYVTNAASNNVSAFTINTSTGALTHVSGSPFATGGTNPYSLTREYYGHFIYVGNSLSNNVSAFKVNTSTGALTHVTGSPFAATKGTQAIKVDPSDKFLYAADAGAEEVLVFKMNTSTGALTETSSTRTHGIGYDINVTNGAAISLQPSIAYVMNNDNDIPFNDFPLATYSINPSTGALTALTATMNTADISGLAVSLNGNILYQTSPGWLESSYVVICSIVASNGTCPNSYQVNSDRTGADDPQGVYHYDGTTDFDTGIYLGINGYKFAGSGSTFTMTLVSGSPFAPYYGEPVGFDPEGKFLYTDADIAFSVSPATGNLTYSASVGTPYNTDIHPNGRFLYAGISGGVLANGISPTDGSLTTLSFSSTSGGTPLIEQSGQFAYLSDGTKVVLYRINPTTGALTELSTALTTAANVQMDTSGNFLYLILNGTMDVDTGTSITPTLITAYKINHSTGALTLSSSLSFPTLSSSGYTLATSDVLK